MNLQTTTGKTSIRRQLKGRALAAGCAMTLIAATAVGIGIDHVTAHSGGAARPSAQAQMSAAGQPLVQVSSLPAELSDLANLQADALAQFGNARPVVAGDSRSEISDLTNLQAHFLALSGSASTGPIAINSLPATLSDVENLHLLAFGPTPALSPAIRAELSDLDNLQQLVLHPGH